VIHNAFLLLKRPRIPVDHRDARVWDLVRVASRVIHRRNALPRQQKSPLDHEEEAGAGRGG